VSLTDKLPLSRSRIDRDAVSRKIPGFLEQLWASSETAVVVIWRGEALLAPGPTPQLAIFSPGDIPDFRHRIYLGLTTGENRGLAAGTRFVAAVVDDRVGEALEPDVTRWMSARTLAHTLDDLDSGVVIEAWRWQIGTMRMLFHRRPGPSPQTPKPAGLGLTPKQGVMCFPGPMLRSSCS